MATAASPFTIKTYQRLVEALEVQRRLGCRSAEQAADALRRLLIGQLGLRRFLGYRLNSHTNAPAAGWTVEFEYGQRQVHLQNGDLALVEALALIIESEYLQGDLWPTAVKKEGVCIEL